ncbi:ATP-dependent helicase HrpB [Thiovibrio frasassiensis]|uniref:ATP-dependent helicase HrpB n=1 Tax=Thiovibrio frasassiensis TaxID=2984131 RepID=A0A9X4MEV9_9BACT|nr:ATP-dependent helicase HrpB [Thiovibrio frasassiensis]MDG4475016.1 ATP-dependent helicase HrpB [Thiovibrio frasassiensis]
MHKILPELRAQFANHAAVVLSAPPGSGKTTVVPPALLAEPWLAGSTILMLEPRRLAARMAATFMAKQLGEEVGQTVGYRVRFEAKVSKATRVEVVTEGVLTRRMQDDPELTGVGLVIFDEFHERSLQADLALALCLDVMSGLREDLKLLIMSATLDTGAVSTLLNNAPVVMGAGQSYPVGVEYCRAGQLPQPQPQPREIAKQVSATIHRALAEQPGDILAFLPGGAEIRHTQALLNAALPSAEIAIHPLFGDLSLAAQTAAVQPDRQGKRRIILATPIAETSITIEGIHTVVDSGWKRSPQFDPNSGLSRLTTQRISRASATQRTGRAGRLGPGYCYRLWSLGEEHGLKPFDPPEILSADLSQLVLDLARWGIHAPSGLRWLDPPPPGHFAQAQEVLHALGALDQQNRITPLGRKMAELPTHPRLGLMLLGAAKQGASSLACDLAALLGERDIIKGRDRSADIEDRLHALAAFRSDGPAAAKALGADTDGCRRVIQTSRQLWEHLPKPARTKGDAPAKTAAAATAAAATAGELLALAFPDRIGQRRALGQGQYKLTSGRGAVLPAHDRLAAHEYLTVAELDAGRIEGRIFLAAPLSKEALMILFAPRLQREEKVFWEEQSGSVKGQRVVRLEELVLATAPLAKPSAEAVLTALLSGIRTLGLSVLPWSEKATELRARLQCLHLWQPDGGWPDLSEAWLLENLEQWLAPYLSGIRNAEQLKKLDLAAILTALLDWKYQSQLDREAPTHLTVPSGSKVRLHYTPGEPPVLAVRLQEMFGLADTPRICNNAVTVLLHLLSPAQRPMQITQDLRGFWEGAYHEVKKELRGRYPKHHWPDDPWQAQPTRRIKPRK